MNKMKFMDLAKMRYSVRKYEEKIVKESFNIPDNLEPINILAIGYSSDEAGSLASSPDRHNEQRKPLDDTVFYETF
jgi:nitroreductase